ncbi:MAG: hypothetical protein ACRDTT_02535 [Pseudonocardiaceae bacterium]
MIDDPTPTRRTAINLPIQARPVSRDDDWVGPPTQDPHGGVEAARSRCSSMRGLARQMCYATNYGVSV